jgi:predicted HicB family RNase H-like nuclease
MNQLKEKTLVVQIPNELHKKFKVKAAMKGKKMRELIIEALKNYE